MTDFQAIILAAGKGTRMKSDLPKVLHGVLGRSMIEHVARAALDAGAQRVVAIVGYGREQVEAHLRERLGDRVEFAVQDEQLGTGHAVWAARDFLRDGPQWSMILSGDTPNLDAEVVREFFDATLAAEAPLGLVTARPADAASYGRVVRDDAGEVQRIVEFKDASVEEQEIGEINSGLYAGRSSFLAEHLETICSREPDNAQGEYYLTDLVAMAAKKDRAFGWTIDDDEYLRGVNTRAELARATAFRQQKINERWMVEGVTMLAPETVLIEPGVELEADVVIYPGVHLRGQTRVGGGAVIENGCVVEDCEIAGGAHLKPYCHLESSRVDADSAIGPFAHLRPGSDIGKGCKVGNFVEVKKSRLEDGAKAGHLSYLGDAHVGAGANIGAGTITCNYDGEKKHRTDIGQGAFIGSNTALVAPVRVGDGAYVGAGSTITNEVPDDALGVARGRQRNIEGWAKRSK